jgi:hypothetical protein
MVRKIREEHARKLNFDIRAIVADAQKRQMHSGRRIVSFSGAPRPESRTSGQE